MSSHPLNVATFVCAVASVANAEASSQSDLSQTQLPRAETPGETEAASPQSRFSLDLSVTYASDYFFRGIVQRSDAFNIQPAAELGFRVFESESLSLSVVAGTWSNFSDDKAAGSTDGFTEHWYEHDSYTGLSFSMNRFTLGALYTWYNSPSSDFKETEDVTLSLTFDDSGLWEEKAAFSLNPFASIAIETHNAASGPDSGIWLGLGVEPTINLGDTPIGSATLSFPIGVGLSLDDYYQKRNGQSETFGYVELGTKLSLALSERLGSAAPSLEFGVSYLILGGVLDDLNDGDSDEVVFSVGLSWSF